jgi:hypothetical protein
VTPNTSATPAPRVPATAEPTHPCARCGKPVGPGIGLCEECNPLGLRDVASGQVHGSVFIAVAVAIVLLAVAARLSVAGIGPFPATVDGVAAAGDGLTVTMTVTNEGDSAGQTNCRISRAGDPGTGAAAFVISPRLESHESRTFSTVVTELGTQPGDLQIACRTP